MFRIHAATDPTGVIYGHPGGNFTDHQFVCDPVGQQITPMLPQLAVAAGSSRSRPRTDATGPDPASGVGFRHKPISELSHPVGLSESYALIHPSLPIPRQGIPSGSRCSPLHTMEPSRRPPGGRFDGKCGRVAHHLPVGSHPCGCNLNCMPSGPRFTGTPPALQWCRQPFLRACSDARSGTTYWTRPWASLSATRPIEPESRRSRSSPMRIDGAIISTASWPSRVSLPPSLGLNENFHV